MEISKLESLEVLRPRTAGEVIDAAFAIFRQQPGKIIGSALPVLLVVESLALVGQLTALKGLRDAFRNGLFAIPVPIWVTAGESLLSVGAWLLEFFITFAVITAATRAYLGEHVSIANCYREIWRRGIGVVSLFVIWFATVLLPIFASTALLVLVEPSFGILTMFATIPWTVFAFVSFRLAPAAFVVEGASPVDAMKRSFQLVRRSWWRTFGIVLMTEVITWIVNTAIQTLILALTASRPPSGAGFYAIAATMVLIPAMTVRPFAAIVDVCLYFDLRVRREALDIEAACALADAKDLPLKPRIVEAKWKYPWSPVPSSISGRR